MDLPVFVSICTLSELHAPFTPLKGGPCMDGGPHFLFYHSPDSLPLVVSAGRFGSFGAINAVVLKVDSRDSLGSFRRV